MKGEPSKQKKQTSKGVKKMSNLTFRDFSLNQTTILGRRTASVTVDSVAYRYKRDPETRKPTSEMEGVNVDIIAARGKCQTVKLPITCKDTVEKISEALRNEKIVKVNFGESGSTLRGRCYAMYANGQLLSGVSCTATEINIVAIEEPEDDLDDIIADIE